MTSGTVSVHSMAIYFILNAVFTFLAAAIQNKFREVLCVCEHKFLNFKEECKFTLLKAKWQKKKENWTHDRSIKWGMKGVR
jgi:4-amino-4-deoxy-L-arabinose transferase-like glycosyltransferase